MATLSGHRLPGGVGDDISEAEPLLQEASLSLGEGNEAPSADNMASSLQAFSSVDDPSLPSHGEVIKIPLQSTTDESDTDSAYLRAQGHEAALQRSFSPLAALGLGFSITNSWVGYLSNFGQNLFYGGPQNVVFGLLVATAVQWTITLGLSEIASAFPSAGVSGKIFPDKMWHGLK
ncbi:MAG: hypothetical protein Q9187_002000 [Circinaria calcarea]